jgi:hypothetical protein
MNEIFSKTISSFQPIWEITVCILIGFVARGNQDKNDLCIYKIEEHKTLITLYF